MATKKSLKKTKTTGLQKDKPVVRPDYWKDIEIPDEPDISVIPDNVMAPRKTEKFSEQDIMELSFRPKQKAYWTHANKKYNFKVGAAGVGKTYMDLFLIPKRILELKERPKKAQDKAVIIGRTFAAVKRNIYEPLKEMYGPGVVTNINSEGTFLLFDYPVTIFGADNVASSEKIQGQTVVYAYGDEVATWHPGVFIELTNRMRSDFSIFDGTCNPKGPDHWLKQFIDKLMDNAEKSKMGEMDEETGARYLDEIFHQHYVIDDGTLSEDIKASLKASLKGTVEYARRILGLWAASEGLIYQTYSGDPERFYRGKKELPEFTSIQLGVDFGYGAANHAIVASAISVDGKHLITLRSIKISSSDEGPSFLANAVYKAIDEIEGAYEVPVDYIWYDAANKTFGNEIRMLLHKKGKRKIKVDKCYKGEITGRITLTQQLMNVGRFHLVIDDCESLHGALTQAVWDPKKDNVRLKDGSTDIDTLDAFEYSFHRKDKILIKHDYMEVA